MVFFPIRIFEFAWMATRTSSSQTNPTGLDSFFSAFGFDGSNSLNDDKGGATGMEIGAGLPSPGARPPSRLSLKAGEGLMRCPSH